MPQEAVPTIRIDLSYARGQMSTWTFEFSLIGVPGLMGKQIGLAVRNGQTLILVRPNSVGYHSDDHIVVQVKGLKRAAERLSKLYNAQVVITSDRTWTCGDRAREMFGTYGSYTPPPPPVPATVHPMPMLREAHAEYHARVRGEFTGTKLGFCAMVNGCTNIAAKIVKADVVNDKYAASCKAHEPIPDMVLAHAVDLVRANGKVYVKEATSFGIDRAVFVRAVANGALVLIQEGPYTRWEVPLPGGQAVSAMFHKHKSTSAARRRRGGA